MSFYFSDSLLSLYFWIFGFSETKERRRTIARNKIALRKIGNSTRQETRAQTESQKQWFFRQGLIIA